MASIFRGGLIGKAFEHGRKSLQAKKGKFPQGSEKYTGIKPGGLPGGGNNRQPAKGGRSTGPTKTLLS